MPLATPGFWYGSRASWQARLLRPCGWLYGLAVAGHRATSRPLRLPVPVLSIGNITLGGTGKTPLVIALALEFCRRGLRPLLIGTHINDAADEASTVSGDRARCT